MGETPKVIELPALKVSSAAPSVLPRPPYVKADPAKPVALSSSHAPSTVAVEVDALNPDLVNLKHLCAMDRQAWELMKPELEKRSKAYRKSDAYKLFARLAPQGMPLMLVGDAGTGKSEGVMVYGLENDRPVLRFTCSGATNWDDFIGRFILRDKRTEFMYGPLARAAEMGAILLLDEANHLRAEEIGGLMGIAEGAPLMVKENRGEVIVPKPGFQIICTANGVGAEQMHLAAGTRQMNMALLDRFLAVIDFEYPTAAEEKKRLKAHGFEEIICDAVASTAQLVRGAIELGQISGYWGTRSSIRMAKMLEMGIDVETTLGLMMRVFDKSQAETISEALLRVLDPFKQKQLERKEEAKRIEAEAQDPAKVPHKRRTRKAGAAVAAAGATAATDATSESDPEVEAEPEPAQATSPAGTPSQASGHPYLNKGDRVIRGQDWSWGDQDGNGVGVVLGPSEEGVVGWVMVQWQNGYKNEYRYGLVETHRDGYSNIVSTGEYYDLKLAN